MFKKLEPIFDILGEILAVLLVVVWILSLANAQWGFLNNVNWLLKTVTYLRQFGGLLLMAIVGLEAMCKRNIVFFIVFCAMLAIIVIFLFFPDTYSNLIGVIKK